jgi:hypothetical protein
MNNLLSGAENCLLSPQSHSGHREIDSFGLSGDTDKPKNCPPLLGHFLARSLTVYGESAPPDSP